MRTALALDGGRSLPRAVERVRLAESLGYESAWVTHIAAREPLQLLSAYAHATERIGLATGVVPMVLRHPALLAMEAATLDEVSGGRLTLGIGTSHRSIVEGWYGLSLDDPVGRMREYTGIVRSILRTGSASVEGTHHTARFSFMGYRGREDLRIVWAAMGPRMLRAAAELADGVVLWMCSPAHIRDSIRPVLDRALVEGGRSPEAFDVVAAVPCALTEDPEGGREAFRRAAFPYLQLPFYRKEVRRAHPDALASFDELLAGGDVDGAMGALEPSFTDDYAGIGDEDAVRAKVEEYRAAGVTLPMVSALGRHEGSLGVEALMEKAAPR